MGRLYADEVVEHLRNFGHDVLTVQEAGNANLKIPDDRVLDFARNRKDFKRLHRSHPDHGGIIICTDDGDRMALAERIHAAILGDEILVGKLVSVVRPMK
jgi:hypothetical protein